MKLIPDVTRLRGWFETDELHTRFYPNINGILLGGSEPEYFTDYESAEKRAKEWVDIIKNNKELLKAISLC